MMIEPIIVLCCIMICYFAIRVNRVEMRMNVLEKELNKILKERGEVPLDTEALGKPFAEDATVTDTLKGVWKALKS